MADSTSSIGNFCLFFLFLNCLELATEIKGEELGAKDFKVVAPWADTIADDLVNDVSQYSSFDTIRDEYVAKTDNPPKENLEWQNINGQQLLEIMQSDLEVLLSGKVEALKKAVERAQELEEEFDYDVLKDHLEEYERVEYLSMKPAEDEDPFSNATFDPAVGRKVILDQSAVHIPVEVYDKEEAVLEAINWTAGLESVWMENRAEDPKLAWQYFGSSTGFMRTYPAAAWTFPMGDVDLYDCRRRPWYTQGSSSPKDMLILVDTSGSSHGQALELMRIATKTLIDTLGEGDFVLLAHFPIKVEDENITEEYPSRETCKKPDEYVKHQASMMEGSSSADHTNTYEVSCFNTFVQANNRNKKILFEAVDRLTAHGMADFGEAFCWAFDQFEKFRKIRHIGSNCTEMIMVLTDGSTQYPEEVFKTRNPDKQVRVFTYAVGVAATATATVKKMACQNKGYFSPIPAMGAINTKVQEYEPVISRPFAMAQPHQLHWTSSYVDAPQVGTGMVITATIPVFKKAREIVDENGNKNLEANSSKILGVMGLDIRTEELQQIQPSQTLGPSGYSFAINNNGLVIFHPRLRTEMGYLKDPPNVDLLDVEYETPEMEEIRNAMVDGKKGKRSIRTCAKSMDDKHIECGVRMYYYAPIPGTPISLGISIPDTAKTVLTVKGIKPKESLKGFEEDIAHSGESRIIIAPWDYCGAEPGATGDAENDIVTAIRDLNCTSARLQHLLFDAELTRSVTKEWGGVKEGIVNSFVSTVGGVTRIFPHEDESMDKLTDTWKEVFFRRAIDTPASWIFIPEEAAKDSNDTEPHIKVAKAVALDNDYRPAVAGIHVTHTYMRDVMVKHTANSQLSCANSDDTICFLLDEGAFVVTSNQDDDQAGVFFGKLEPHIMNKMIELSVYERYEEYDFQGTCAVQRKYNSAGPRGFWVPSFIPYNALTLTWWTSRAAAAWAQFNVFSWLHSLVGSFNGVSAILEEDDENVYYRACILKQAQYDFGKILEKTGQAYADVPICNCTRSFGASLVKGTNLLLVVAESDAFCDESDCDLPQEDKPLQQPQEDSGPSLGDRICAQQSKPRHRNLLKGQCISRHPSEEKMDFPCGSAFGLLPSPLLVFASFILGCMISLSV